MATSCASSAIAAVAFSSPSSQKNGSIVGTTKASFLGGRRLRVSKFTAPAGTRSVSTVCAVADPERPLWFPGSTPPPWLDGRSVFASILSSRDLFFLRTRQAFTPEQINESCYVDVNANKTVFDSLRNNPKVYYDGRRFSYKSKHDLKDEHQLLVLIRKFPEGIAVIDLKDAYPTVMDDLQSLKAAGKIWLLSNFDSQEDIAYPNDPRVPIKVDDDLKQLFRGIEFPCDMIDIEKDLQKNGMKPATNTAKRRAMAQVHGIAPKPKQKKKQHEISKRTKLTNAHLPELFKNLGS